MNEKRIIDYAAIKAASTMDLTTYVMQYIKDGWQPIGGISSASVVADLETGKPSNLVMFSQALVKYN